MDEQLIQLFEALRRADFSLGVDSLSLLFAALDRGLGVQDREALRRLCRALWCSSREEAGRLDQLFDRYIPQLVARETQPAPRPAAPAESEPEPAGGPEPLSTSSAPAPLQTAPRLEPRPPGNLPPAPVAPRAAEPLDTALNLDTSLAAQLVLSAIAGESPAPAAFAESDELFFPITRRQMKQSWRYLRRMVREGYPSELDVEATVRAYRSSGILLRMFLRPPRVNKAELLLLVDRGGSMVPFHDLGDRLVFTGWRGGRLGQFHAYSFHDYPEQYLFDYLRPAGAIALGQVLADLHPEHGAALVFSDAGAARGNLSLGRARATAGFLAELRRHVRRVAWLNPMPRARWTGTTAEQIAAEVPMFETDRRGMQLAIKALRSRGPQRQEAV